MSRTYLALPIPLAKMDEPLRALDTGRFRVPWG
jgi:hypothetical protein